MIDAHNDSFRRKGKRRVVTITVRWNSGEATGTENREELGPGSGEPSNMSSAEQVDSVEEEPGDDIEYEQETGEECESGEEEESNEAIGEVREEKAEESDEATSDPSPTPPLRQSKPVQTPVVAEHKAKAKAKQQRQKALNKKSKGKSKTLTHRDQEGDNRNTLDSLHIQKTGNKKHIMFDEDEDFENLPAMKLLSKRPSRAPNAEDSDSDAAPEVATLATGKEVAEKEDEKQNIEVKRVKQQVKEKRKRKLERNILQQEEKRKRLRKLAKTRRFPESLLDAVVAEQQQQKAAFKKSTEKHKNFTDLEKEDGGGDTMKEVDQDGIIPLKTGVKVQSLSQETKKYASIAGEAAAFRERALYGGRVRRIPSKDLHQMKVKQKMSGKSILEMGHNRAVNPPPHHRHRNP